MADRLANRIQLITDGRTAYLEAVDGAFGAGIDYAMLIKLYGPEPKEAQHHYSPSECIGIETKRTHKSLNNLYFRTPAMAWGLTDHIWSTEEMLSLLDKSN